MIAGRMGSGKNYLSEKLRDQRSNVILLSFAYKLKSMLAKLFDTTVKELDTLKDAHGTIHFRRKSIILHNHKIEISGLMRRCMQWLGTDVVRNIDIDYWVKCMINKIRQYEDQDVIICIKDWRFINEYEKLEKQFPEKIIKIWIEGGRDKEGKHQSEWALQSYPMDHYIENKKHDNNSLIENIEKLKRISE